MDDKKFNCVIIAVIIIGFISSSALAAYTVYRHNNSSIVTYIGNEA